MPELSLKSRDIHDLLTSSLKLAGPVNVEPFNIKIECLGNSMAPFIRHKNLLTISPAGNPNIPIRTGDIVVAANRKKARIIIHRIIQIKTDHYLLKGDNLKNPDGWFNRSDIIGKIIKIENKYGRGYTPRSWQNRIIALASRFNAIRSRLLPGLSFLKTGQTKRFEY